MQLDIQDSEREMTNPDGVYAKKYGSSTVTVSVFIDRQNDITAQDRFMWLMLEDAAKEVV